MKKLSDSAQEILEGLWINIEEKKKEADAGLLRDDPALAELRMGSYVKISGREITLTKKGLQEARACVRRHRLAERLMVDVFNLKKGEIHDAGCKFEHAIHEYLEENICTLLGHPRECPHGSPIPAGRCCKKAVSHATPVVKSLANLRKGEAGIIAYIHTGNRKELQKVMAMGALPGNRIRLRQRFPSYVFDIGSSQFAIDKGMAQNIFIRPAGG